LTIFADNPLASIAIALSLFAFWLNYRTSRRQKFIEDPFLTLTRGPHADRIIITNQGRTTAANLGIRTEHGGFIRWPKQVNEVLQKQDSMGGFFGGEDPWTTDCSGDTRTIGPGESVSLVLAHQLSSQESLFLSFENYLGERINHRYQLSEITKGRRAKRL